MWIRNLHCGSVFYTVDLYYTLWIRILHVWNRILHVWILILHVWIHIIHCVSLFYTVDPSFARVDSYFTLWVRILHCGSLLYTVDPYFTRVEPYFHVWILILHVWIRILHSGSLFYTVDPYFTRVEAYFTCVDPYFALWIRNLHVWNRILHVWNRILHVWIRILHRGSLFYILCICTIVHAVRRGLLTPTTRVPAQVSPSGLYGGECGAGTGFLRLLQFPLSASFRQCSVLVRPSVTLYDINNCKRR